jgi:Predicted protease
MSGKNNRKLLTAGVVIAAIVALSLAILGPSSFLNYFGKATLSGNTPAAITHSQRVNHAEGTERMEIVVSLNLRDEAALNQLLQDMRDPASPQYRKFISASEFANRFAPANSDVDRVVLFLKEYGIQVTEISPNRTLISASGTVSQLERAFGVTINKYSMRVSGATAKGTKIFLSNDRDPRIPSSLEPIVLSVIGLDTLAEFESRMLRNSRAAAPQTTKPWGFSPQDIARVYDFPNANNDNNTSNLSGKGKTIAIATANTYDVKDIEEFWKQYNITRTGKLIDVHVGGTATTIDGETTLDLELASSQAPGADVMMYLGKDPKFTTFTKVFNKIVTDDKADVMSVSWGLCETNTGTRQMRTEHNIFKQGAAQGIAMFAASGDDGAYDCKPPKKDDDDKDKDKDTTAAPKTPDLAVDYPSSDPFIIGVGGTTLYGWDGKRSSESAWYGSGGGISDEWPRQSWQHGPGVPTSDNRPSADVSLVANPGTGYAIYFEGKWQEIGGTSAAAPSWAALWTLIDEGANKRIGDPGEILYRVGRSLDYQFNFHDITTGDNGDFRGPGYKAGPNWDHPTGWGVPKGQKLKDWIVKDQTPSTP